MDDAHTKIFFVRFEPAEDSGLIEEGGDPPIEYVAAYKDPPDAIHPFTRFRMDEVQAQDHMAWETQGPIADRTVERLGTTDGGVVMLREMLRREIEAVERGLDPLGVIRDPEHAMIDTNLMGPGQASRGTPEGRRESDAVGGRTSILPVR
jgi:5,5'-dehydrodivanillate O-demethylase